jgi:hypothetical protein
MGESGIGPLNTASAPARARSGSLRLDQHTASHFLGSREWPPQAATIEELAARVVASRMRYLQLVSTAQALIVQAEAALLARPSLKSKKQTPLHQNALTRSLLSSPSASHALAGISSAQLWRSGRPGTGSVRAREV